MHRCKRQPDQSGTPSLLAESAEFQLLERCISASRTISDSYANQAAFEAVWTPIGTSVTNSHCFLQHRLNRPIRLRSRKYRRQRTTEISSLCRHERRELAINSFGALIFSISNAPIAACATFLTFKTRPISWYRWGLDLTENVELLIWPVSWAISGRGCRRRRRRAEFDFLPS